MNLIQLELKLIQLFLLLVLFMQGCGSIRKSNSSEVYAVLEAALARGNSGMRINTKESLEVAESSFTLGAELAPRDPRPIDGLGCVEWRKRNYSKAAKYFMKAIELDRNYARGYAHLGMYYILNGNYKEANENMELAVRLSPLDAQTRNNYAALLARINTRNKTVKEEMLKAILTTRGRDESVVINESYKKLLRDIE